MSAAGHDVPCPMPRCPGRCAGDPGHRCIACGAQVCSREWL